MNDLAHVIASTALVDTHEHLGDEAPYRAATPDILACLFDGYTVADLVSAGAPAAAIKRLHDKADPDLRARFEGIRPAWEAVQFTGYGEGVRYIARTLFGLDELSAAGIEQAAALAVPMHAPGERLRLLREVAKLDHVQIDDFSCQITPDPFAPDFFLYDLSWWTWTCGNFRPEDIEEVRSATGVVIRDLDTLREGLSALFAKTAARAIAVKTQHAYDRTLRWAARDDAEAARALHKVLGGAQLSADDRLCLGDWCLGLAAGLAAEHNLPVKIHCGYYAGNNRMPMDRIHASHLAPLLAAYPRTRFVLMHTAYPFGGEVVALAKHYTNVYADMCWAWSIDPYSSETFVRQFLHAAPASKLFIFGGDSFMPQASVAYAWQARRGLARALQAEVESGFLRESQAIALALRWMRGNAYECFDVARAQHAA